MNWTWCMVTLSFAVVGVLSLPQNFDEAVREAKQRNVIPMDSILEEAFPVDQVAFFQLRDNERIGHNDLTRVLNGIPSNIISHLQLELTKAQ